jgi:hypothetical protein
MGTLITLAGIWTAARLAGATVFVSPLQGNETSGENEYMLLLSELLPVTVCYWKVLSFAEQNRGSKSHCGSPVSHLTYICLICVNIHVYQLRHTLPSLSGPKCSKYLLNRASAEIPRFQSTTPPITSNSMILNNTHHVDERSYGSV